MQELISGDQVRLTNGSTASVIKELGRGGQGIVYLVNIAGQQMALKWYTKVPDNNFYKNLESNIADGAPSETFLWPEFLTEKQNGSYGYVMKLRPQGYYEFGKFLLAEYQFKSMEAMLNAAMMICDGFAKLHLQGKSYQDLNDGNFFINPTNGDVLICDNDNVMPNREKSGILGKARYMAPEVVGGKAPETTTDRFSLSVILFLLFYGNHPFEGARVAACPCLTESFEKKFYGSEITFIYDEHNKTNRPVRGVHDNVIALWPAFPKLLRDTFKTQFGEECLRNPSKRLIEREWQKVISQLRDMLVICPKCGNEFFAESKVTKCTDCDNYVTISGFLSISNRDILLTPKTNVYIDNDTSVNAVVVEVPDNKYPIQLKNLMETKWVVETPSGKIRPVEKGQTMPVKAGLKVTISGKQFEIK